MTTLTRHADAIIRVHPADNVAVALRSIPAGETIAEGIVTTAAVERGHKVALTPIATGAGVIKYGERIGSAVADIAPGDPVHSDNLRTDLDERTAFEYDAARRPEGLQPLDDGRTFDGYRRADGRVGTRNEIWIINTVGCVNTSADRIAREASSLLEGKPWIDGVRSFSHPYGCSQLGDDLEDTRRVLAGLAGHPNAGGVLVLGLGCENNQIDALLERAGGLDGDRVRAFSAQEVEDEIEAGVDAVAQLAAVMSKDRRRETPLRDLVVGLKCGGSDALSGLTANPIVGRFADELSRRGGTALLSEIPEMFGAERGLLDRCVDAETFAALAAVIERFRRYFVEHDQPVYENPSPGNKAGGLTTLEEKSLGAVQKGGRAPVTGVLGYGRPLLPREASPRAGRAGGLVVVEAPGNDGVSSTAMTVAGAGVLLFTTGRGTPLGFPAPTVKISSNSELASRKPNWIDFDAGRLLEAGVDADTLANELLDLVVDVASGRVQTCNERQGYREIAIWKRGVTL